MALLTSLNMPPMAQMVLIVVVITLVLSAKHALVESMQKVTQLDVTNTAASAAVAAATASAAAAAAAASPTDSTAAEASAAAAAAAEEAAAIAAETADAAADAAAVPTSTSSASSTSASSTSSSSSSVFDATSSAAEPVGASRKRRTESIVDQLGVTAGLLFFLLFIQLFYFLHDLGYITEPPVGTLTQQLFSYWKLGGFVFAEVARALSLVFLVGASYTTRNGSVKGMLIAATSLLFIELVSGKFEMGQAVCDTWYAARKTAAASQRS